MIILKNKTAEQSGFTIIEVVIVLGVSTVLLIGLLNLFEWHQKVYVMEEATVRTTSAARITLNNMTESIAQSTTIVASRDFGGTSRTTGGNGLVIEVPSVNSSDNVIPTTYDYIAYYIENGSLYQVTEIGAGSVRTDGTRKLADNVQTFALTYDNGTPANASAVTVDLQVQISTRNGNVSTRVTDTIFLRNK